MRENKILKKVLPWITGACLVVLVCLSGGCGKKPEEETSGISGNLDKTEESVSDSFSQGDNLGAETEEGVQEADSENEKDAAEDTGTGNNKNNEGKNIADGQDENDDSEDDGSNREEIAELESFVLYFSGIDVWGWVDTRSRSDVNIIAAVNPNTRHVQLINTPRDYYVEMPVSDGMKDKLTHAGLYGVENSMGTLELLYDIEIDYYIRMNFSGFESIIDTLGGVDVYSEYDFTVEPIKHYTEGYNHLTGLEALAFVRERHAFADGDNQRGRNQMALIQAMVEKVCSPDILVNYSEILDELTDMFRTNIPLELIVDLVGNQLSDDREWTVDTFSVTGTSGSEKTYSVPGTNAYVMIPNENDVSEAKRLVEEVLREE